LWTLAGLEKSRVKKAPVMDRIVVAVDPPVTGHAGSDDCGIIVAGVVMNGPVQDWRAYVLDDVSLRAASPANWARVAIAAMETWGADKLVAEVNQGGDLVAEVIRQVDPLVPYKAVRASRGKVARAEPVAALYEQGKVHHVGAFDTLEDQMSQMAMDGYWGKNSPDRVDALVWALHELIIEPSAKWRRPKMRSL